MSFAMGDAEGAIAAAERVIEKAAHHPAPYKLLGLVYDQMVRATTGP